MTGWISIGGKRVPCRIARVSTLGGELRPVGLTLTHTATIPVTRVERNSTVTDSEGTTFLVVTVDTILNKTRLGLKLQYGS